RYSECGTRIGMIVSHNAEAMKAILKFCQARLSPPLLGQIVAEASIEGTEEYSKACFDEYLARRDFFIAGLNKIPGVYSPMPNGAFYTVASLPVENAEDFCSWCLTDLSYKDSGSPEGFSGETVMMAPAAGFYSTPGLGKNQVRMAYVLKKEDLARSLIVLEKALEAYRAR
ncbi:MAG TPA: pyridoxal phosphate-dependent aminotransferase, partial [Rikenellaceae bacterium]|nr:pyridoxal phosphate-dependent aminotransferase [Rikenellaceae bacterium]